MIAAYLEDDDYELTILNNKFVNMMKLHYAFLGNVEEVDFKKGDIIYFEDYAAYILNISQDGDIFYVDEMRNNNIIIDKHGVITTDNKTHIKVRNKSENYFMFCGVYRKKNNIQKQIENKLNNKIDKKKITLSILTFVAVITIISLCSNEYNDDF